MRNSRRTTSITDFIIEASIPILIIALIWTLVVFAITIKGVYYPGQERTLSFVFFCYVVAAVMINRIAGLYGESDKAAFYSIVLVSVMGLFALTFSARYGALVGGTNAGEGFWANISIIALIGFASYAISRESCFDIKGTTQEKSAIQLRAELRAKRDWHRRMEYEEEQKEKKAAAEKEEARVPVPAKLPRRHPGIWIICFSLFSMAVFAVGQRLLPEDNWPLYLKTFSCLIANLVCALILLALVTLSALRFYCWEKKAFLPGGLGLFWSMAGGALVLIVLSLASLPPRPVPDYFARSVSQEFETIIVEEGEEDGVRSTSLETWGGQSKLINAKLEKEQRDIPRVMEELKSTGAGGGKEAEEDGDKEGGGGERREDKSSAGKSGSGKEESGGMSSGERRSSRRSPKAQTRKGARFAVQQKRAPLPTPPLAGLEKAGMVIVIAMVACGLLWAIAVMFRAIGRSNPLKKISGGLKGFAGRLRGILKRKKRPALSGGRLRASLEREDLLMDNPFGNQSLLDNMSMTELVNYTYRAFENYSHVQGHTPLTGQTPLEFVNSLPEELRAAEFSALLQLFLVAEYSAHTISDRNVQKLRQVWAKMET